MHGIGMRMTVLGLLIVLATALMGTAALAQSRTKLRLAFPSDPDLEDIPSMLVAERLKAQGVELEWTHFAQEVLAIQAVLRGDLDMGTGASRGTLAAIQAGASLKFFVAQARNPWILYSRRDIRNCAEIGGKRFAIHSEGGISTAFVRGWLKENCPTLNISFLIVPGSDNRAAALLAGQIDITPLELPDAMQVESLRPGQYHRLADFSKDMPWLLGSLFYASPRTIAAKRDLIKTYTRELLRIHRLAARDPNVIAAVAPKYVKSLNPAVLPDVTRIWGATGYWPPDGGLTPQILSRTTQFFVDIGSLKPGLKMEEIADYTILAEVLQEIGK